MGSVLSYRFLYHQKLNFERYLDIPENYYSECSMLAKVMYLLNNVTKKLLTRTVCVIFHLWFTTVLFNLCLIIIDESNIFNLAKYSLFFITVSLKSNFYAAKKIKEFKAIEKNRETVISSSMLRDLTGTVVNQTCSS